MVFSAGTSRSSRMKFTLDDMVVLVLRALAALAMESSSGGNSALECSALDHSKEEQCLTLFICGLLRRGERQGEMMRCVI